ncbi:MAG: ABC transporter permease [Firmicutes bacterium]|nr:ABC transporter permease [Bacillota bacterium]
MLALAAVFLGLFAGAVLMMLTGNNPVIGYFNLLRGGLMNLERIGNTLASATPLVFTGLSVAFAFKTGLFNIGAAGQMLIGGLCATAVGLTFDWPKPLLLTFMVFASLIGGGLWAALPGVLKARFNVHEVVSTIMMNWIAYWTVFYVVPRYLKGPFLETESARIPYAASLRAAWLTDMFNGSYINLGVFLAVIFGLLVALLLERTTLGYELKAVGFNRFAAEAAGINVGRNTIISMMIAGALAGVGGVTFYAGYAVNIQIGVLPVQGFDGMAVSLLGANAPLGVAGAAVFFGLLHTGKGFMSAMTRIPPEIADTIIATVIYFAATGVLVERAWTGLKKRKGGVK